MEMWTQEAVDWIKSIRSKGRLLDLSSRDEVGRMLGFMWQVMRATEPLLELAISKSNGKLKEYFAKHLAEEKGHADWLLDDLQFQRPPFNPLAAAMAGSQYYLLNHEVPQAFLGYMLVLETPMLTVEQLEELEAMHGSRLFRCLRHHVQVDPAHNRDLREEIHFHREHSDLIHLNAGQTAYYLTMY